MASRIMIEALACPSCGAIITESDNKCSYCGRSIVFQYIDTDCNNKKEPGSEWNHIHNAAEVLHGKKPFLCSRETIDKCIEILDEAYGGKADALIDYFRAYIEYDYFERKYLKRNPGYKFYLERAETENVSQTEIEMLEKVLKNKINIGGTKA